MYFSFDMRCMVRLQRANLTSARLILANVIEHNETRKWISVCRGVVSRPCVTRGHSTLRRCRAVRADYALNSASLGNACGSDDAMLVRIRTYNHRLARTMDDPGRNDFSVDKQFQRWTSCLRAIFGVVYEARNSKTRWKKGLKKFVFLVVLTRSIMALTMLN